MGANNHRTTRPETDDYRTRRLRLKRDLFECEGVTGVRAGMLADNMVVVETDDEGLRPETLRVLADHDARVGTNKNPSDPFEVFIDV